MWNRLERFEAVARKAYQFTDAPDQGASERHPFEVRNISAKLPSVVRDLFDNGHYAQATFEAFKFLDKEVQRYSHATESGFKLMMQVFSESSPLIRLTSLSNASEKDEQKGLQFLFAGGMLAIRNPRGHEYAINDDPDRCLDHLGLVSMLLRRLADSGFK